LIADGLVRRLAPAEVAASESASDLVELTRAGLTIVAAQQGLSSGRAVRFNGLAGGGPAQPFGQRSSLVRNLIHTRGVDSFFVEMARQLASIGDDAALVEWRNAATCARRCLRPDGYGIVHYQGRFHGFFLEYDRGTMRRPGYLKKLAAYHDYLSSGGFHLDYAGFPTILVVATNNVVEERIARAARAAAVGRSVPLPLLLTCQWRMADKRHQKALLDPIWRRPEADFIDRQVWPPDLCLTSEQYRGDENGTATPLHRTN
jgi:Replication-relaxation